MAIVLDAGAGACHSRRAGRSAGTNFLARTILRRSILLGSGADRIGLVAHVGRAARLLSGRNGARDAVVGVPGQQDGPVVPPRRFRVTSHAGISLSAEAPAAAARADRAGSKE